MHVSASIDWISITSHDVHQQALYPAVLTSGYEDVIARYGYSTARRYTTGAIEMWSPERARMGRHCIYSSGTLRKIQKHHAAMPIDILRWHVRQRHNIARLDIALDVRDSNLDIGALFDAYDNGKCDTRVRSGSLVRGANNSGDTCYIGSQKARKRLLRVYDKGRQLRIPDANWIRIELEYRGKHATAAAPRILESPEGRTIASMIRAHCHWPDDPVWCAIIGDDAIPVTVSNERSDKTLQWIYQQVIPAVARVIVDDPGQRNQILASLDTHIEAIKSGQLHD